MNDYISMTSALTRWPCLSHYNFWPNARFFGRNSQKYVLHYHLDQNTGGEKSEVMHGVCVIYLYV